MNHFPRWALTLALLPMAACSSNPPPMASVAPVGPPPLASADQTFITAAAATDASEIQAGKLAQTKARSPRVKAFAAKMVADHTQTTQQLTTMAQAKGVAISGQPDQMAQDMTAKLESDKPRMFDRDYMHGQVMGHEQAVKVFQTEIDTGQDPDLKAFAQQTLPIIQQHLHMAERLSGRG